VPSISLPGVERAEMLQRPFVVSRPVPPGFRHATGNSSASTGRGNWLDDGPLEGFHQDSAVTTLTWVVLVHSRLRKGPPLSMALLPMPEKMLSIPLVHGRSTSRNLSGYLRAAACG